MHIDTYNNLRKIANQLPSVSTPEGWAVSFVNLDRSLLGRCSATGVTKEASAKSKLFRLILSRPNGFLHKALRYMQTTGKTQKEYARLASLYRKKLYDVSSLRKQYSEHFSNNGLNVNDFTLIGDNATTEALRRSSSYKPNMHVRTNRNPLSGDASKRLDLSGRLWAAPGSAPRHGVGTGDRIVLDDTYIQKYKNGNPVITADTELFDVVSKSILPEYAALEAKLNLRGKTLRNPSRFNSYVSGDPGLRKAVAQVQGFGTGTAQQQILKDVPARLGYETVRDVPHHVSNRISDIREFIPYQSTLRWVPKGSDSALTLPINLRTVTLTPPNADAFNRMLAGWRKTYLGPGELEIALPIE